MNKEHLTEERLGTFLKVIYPNIEFVYNRSVPNSNLPHRPDYRSDELKLIVEFDGYRHYSSSKTIMNDEKKDFKYELMGYNIIRIPYFVQLSPLVVKKLFNKTYDIPQSYPHGFISEKALLPSDFCEIGISRFINDLNKFTYIQRDIIKSLIDHINEVDSILLVLPPHLLYFPEIYDLGGIHDIE